MTYNNKTTSTLKKYLVPAPKLVKAYPTKRSTPLYVSPTFLKPSDQDPMTILGDVLKNTPILDGTNTAVEPTEVFKPIVYNTNEYLSFMTEAIFYEPDTVLLQKLITYTADSVGQLY